MSMLMRNEILEKAEIRHATYNTAYSVEYGEPAQTLHKPK